MPMEDARSGLAAACAVAPGTQDMRETDAGRTSVQLYVAWSGTVCVSAVPRMSKSVHVCVAARGGTVRRVVCATPCRKPWNSVIQ